MAGSARHRRDSNVPPASAGEALGMLACAISYLAAADATQMAAEVQAQCLKGLEQAEAAGTVARASILGAFTAGKGHCDNAAYIAPGVPMGERGSAASAPGRMR